MAVVFLNKLVQLLGKEKSDCDKIVHNRSCNTFKNTSKMGFNGLCLHLRVSNCVSHV